MDKRVIVVGGGLAGLTAAAYLAKAGIRVLLCEKAPKVGGLVNSFMYKGFSFDGGIRALENSGIVKPMLRQLGLDIPLVSNGVSIGIEQDVVNLSDKSSLKDYLALLRGKFPAHAQEIGRFGQEIEKIMQYMDILYGIDNPLFLDLKADRRYLMKTILPWMFKYIVTIGKIDKLDQPVVGYLQRFISSPALIDMIAQHFFQATPTFFALSYFSLYLDYSYPLGGIGVLAEKLKGFILEHQGEILCETEITRIDLAGRQLEDTGGKVYPYEKLIWAADMKRLYSVIDLEAIDDQKVRKKAAARRESLKELSGNDSILSLYLTVDLDQRYFAEKSNAHFFYTPEREGLSGTDTADMAVKSSRDWLNRFFRLTTYEISCPVLRDANLAPPGQAGLIVSTLFDYALAKKITDMGWYEEFKEFSANAIIDVLNESIYPGIKEKVMDKMVSTPLTLQRLTGNTDGAITGWAFTNAPLPNVHKMTKVAKSVETPLTDVYQAGQWVFSPSGLPISILTGKLAADRVIKDLK